MKIVHVKSFERYASRGYRPLEPTILCSIFEVIAKIARQNILQNYSELFFFYFAILISEEKKT